jgi:hypothetical protein
VALAAAFLGATLAWPAPVGAADPEPQILPGDAVLSAIADLDANGVDDVVRVVLDDGQLAVDAWRLDGATWRLVDAVPAPLTEPDSDASTWPRGPRIPELAGLMRWRHAGRDEVLLVTARFDPDSEFGTPCCLAASRGRLDGDRLVVEPMDLGGRGFESFYPIDLDGDGTDELFTTATRYESHTDDGTTVIELLAWDGTAWVTRWHEEFSPPGYSLLTREGDGRSFAHALLRRGDGQVTRILARGGEIIEERASLDGLVGAEPWLAGAAGDHLVMTTGNGIHVVRWPIGGDPSSIARVRRADFPNVQVVGRGDDAMVLVHGEGPRGGLVEPRIELYDLALDRVGTIEFDDPVRAAWQRAGLGGMWTDSGRPLFPYIGPFPGLDAYVAGGTLVQPDGMGGYDATPMASMIGSAIVGVAGGGDWVVLGDGFGAPAGVLQMLATFPGAAGRTTFVPAAQLFDRRPELAGSMALRGAVELAADVGRTTVAAEGDGFMVIVTALPGTAVVVLEPVTRVHEVRDWPLEIPIRPSRSGDLDLPLQTDLLIMSPTGQAALHRLEGTFVRNPPELAVSATTDVLAPRASVRGRASPGATVRIDGREVEASASGRFEMPVDAPIWPRTVIVTATDVLGNETEQRLEVVGVVDYRGWPWLPITAVGTLGVGAIMVLRVPGRRPGISTADDDAVFEEMDPLD